MDGTTLIWTWIAGLLTLCIFSFLYKDNPFYKFAEHLYVGVSAGYYIALNYHEVIEKILIEGLQAGKYHLIVPAVLGIMMCMQLGPPSVRWLARYPLSFIVGMGSGYAIVVTMDAAIMEQIRSTIVPLASGTSVAQVVKNWLILLGVSCGLVYFYFSVEHKGPIFGTASRIGIWVLMITFGAAFGNTVMARVSLLIGRMLFIKDEWIGGTMQYFSGGS